MQKSKSQLKPLKISEQAEEKKGILLTVMPKIKPSIGGPLNNATSDLLPPPEDCLLSERDTPVVIYFGSQSGTYFMCRLNALRM